MFAEIKAIEHGMAITGKLVFATVSEIIKQGNQFIEQTIQTNQKDFFEIDCVHIERIDSAGIATLIDWRRQCTAAQIDVRFINLPEQAKSLIKAYRLDPFLQH